MLGGNTNTGKTMVQRDASDTQHSCNVGASDKVQREGTQKHWGLSGCLRRAPDGPCRVDVGVGESRGTPGEKVRLEDLLPTGREREATVGPACAHGQARSRVKPTWVRWPRNNSGLEQSVAAIVAECRTLRDASATSTPSYGRHGVVLPGLFGERRCLLAFVHLLWLAGCTPVCFPVTQFVCCTQGTLLALARIILTTITLARVGMSPIHLIDSTLVGWVCRRSIPSA